MDGNPRVENGTVDIGCYEFTITESLMRVSTYTLDFGEVLFDETNQLTLVVKNIGAEVLNGDLEGTGLPFYLVSSDSYSIAPTSDVAVLFDFVPAEYGTITNTVILTGGRGAIVELIGMGIPEPVGIITILLISGVAFIRNRFSF